MDLTGQPPARSRAATCFAGLLFAAWVCVPLGAQTPPPSPPAGQPAPGGAPPGAPGQPPPGAPQEVTPSGQPAAAPSAAAALKFTTPAAALLATIKPDKTGDFESLLKMYADALRANGDPAVAKMAATFRFYKVAEPAPAGTNALYLILIEPVDLDADYSWKHILGVLYTAHPDQAATIFEQASTVHAAPMNKLSLTPLGQAPPTEAAPPKP